MTPSRVAELAASLFASGGSLHGRYTPSDEPFAPISGAVAGWQAPIYPAGSVSPRILRAYPVDVPSGSLVRAHWRNEVRALLRLSSAEHPSLPAFREASYIDQERLGFAILDDPGVPIVDGHPLADALRRDPVLAFLRWFALLEAAMLMQDEGLIHRAISPLTVCALEDPDAQVRLDGFQMSAFVSAWMSRPGADAPSPWLDVLAGPALACLSPERAGPLVGQPRRFPEGYRGDVFGLGILGVLWLAPVGTEWAAELSAREYTESRHRDAVLALRTHAARSSMPRTLWKLLEQMTSFEPSNRLPSARAAYEEVAKVHGFILRELVERREPQARPRLVCYLKQTIDRLFQDCRTSSAPQQPDYDEYNNFIARDLDGAVLVWSPDGFSRWEALDERAKLARIVLLGREYAYFSQYLDEGVGAANERALVIKYPLPAQQARELRHAVRTVPVPDVTVQFLVTGGRARLPGDLPSWRSLVASIETAAATAGTPAIVQAGNWLLGAQRATTSAQQYRFRRDLSAGSAIVLRQHEDASEIKPDTEEGAFLSLHREVFTQAPMGRHFLGIARRAKEEETLPRFEWSARPGERAFPEPLIFEEMLDEYTVRFRTNEVLAGMVPGEGYVRPVDATRAVAQRQRAALLDLEMRQRHLAAQLTRPRGVRLRDDGGAPNARRSATPPLIEQLLETWPLFAVQGPPGTGKTHHAALLIREAVARDPLIRLIVSAQSHHALDNLLEGVLRQFADPSEVLVLRVASERTTGKVDDAAQKYLMKPQVERITKAACEARRSSNGQLGQIVRAWHSALKEGKVDGDLAHRLGRSATIVFATCAGAGAEALEDARARSFDWVIAEEAARGWITEFLVPLVRGARWLLIGDQAQLPAFGRSEIERMFQRDVDTGRTSSVTGTAVDPSWREQFFRYFDHLMQSSGASAHVATSVTLDEQHRMHPDIGEMVGRTFYPKGLRHHPGTRRPHGLSVCGTKRDTALLWVDTSSFGARAWEQQSDKGLMNLTERRLVKWLVGRGIHPKPYDARTPAFAILSPYWGQVRALSEHVTTVDREVVRTVDSVQGREADVVIVSLARNNSHSDPRAALGFLEEPERVNVMFSRARRLLVIVGALRHFERHGIDHWERIGRYIRSEPRFLVDAGELGFRVEGD
jgi:hypothetical protein